jgi:RNase adapter protein RapZ
VDRVAAVIDVRSRAFGSDLQAALTELDRLGLHPRLLFLEASDETLIRRFDGVRRPHPLQGDGTLVDGISAERERLRDIRGEADMVLDTSDLNIHELRAKITALLGGARERLVLTVVSFGYKYGLPVDADIVLDCRLLPNPHWVDELRPQSGLDQPVRDWVLGQEGAGEFVDELTTLLRRYAAGYPDEGKHFATIAVGCTGGKHRSVAITEELVHRLSANPEIDVHSVHRDLGRE